MSSGSHLRTCHPQQPQEGQVRLLQFVSFLEHYYCEYKNKVKIKETTQ